MSIWDLEKIKILEFALQLETQQNIAISFDSVVVANMENGH